MISRPQLALLVALSFEIVLYVIGRGDMVPSDPLWYADIAHTLATKPATLFATPEKHPFVMRLGLTVPLSLFYRAFGVSTLVTNLPSLLSQLAITATVFAAAKTPRGKLLGLAFCVACRPLVAHAAILNVDLPCAALLGVSVLCLSRRQLVLAIVAWFAAFLVKEAAVWCAPVWLYVIVCDLRASGIRDVARRYAPALAVGIALAIAYLVLCWYLWGSPLARFQGIEELTYEHAWTLQGKPASAWLARLTWQPLKLLVDMFHVTLVPIVAAVWLVRGRERVWLVAAATFLFAYWFGSASLSAYNPLPISERMILSVLPPFLVLATLATDEALARTQGRWRLAIAIPLALALIVPALLEMRTAIARHRPETAAFAILEREVASGDRIVIVCAEPRCTAVANFYFGLEPPPPTATILAASDFAHATIPPGAKVRAVVNARRATSAGLADTARRIDALGLPTLLSDRNVRLYDAGDGVRLQQALVP